MLTILVQIAMGIVAGAVCQLVGIPLIFTVPICILAAWWIGKDMANLDPIKKETDAMFASVQKKLR